MLNYRNETLLSDGTYLGHMTETVVFNHILTLAEMQNYKLAYWRDKSKSEVDIILDMHKQVVPIEVKYQSKITKQDVKGVLKFMNKFDVDKGMLVTRNVFKKESYDGKEIIFVPMWVFLVAM